MIPWTTNKEEEELANKAQRYIEDVKKQLPGFHFVELETSLANLQNLQSYTNSIVYRDKTTNQKSIIIPCYPEREGGPIALDSGNNGANLKALTGAGFKVITSPDHGAYLSGGNLHCLTNRL